MTEFADRPTGRIDDMTTAELTRRGFLRVAALGASAYFLAGCEGGEKDVQPDRFSKTPAFEQNFETMPDGPLDRQIWNIKLGPEKFNGAGKQIYTDKEANVAIKNKRLVITAFEQKMSGMPFTSARVDTEGKQAFGFGRFVVRAQMPAGRGVHPGLWMRRVPKPGENGIYGEIDIAEYVGHRPDRAFINLHTTATNKAGDGGIVTRDSKEGVVVKGVSDRIVEYAVERTAAGIAFFVDGAQAGPLYTPQGEGKNEWPFGADDEYYFIANLAIGDRWGGSQGIDTTTDPWQLQIASIQFFPEVAR